MIADEEECIMKTKMLWIVWIMAAFLSADSSWAAEKGYGYVVAYSYQKKVVYNTPIFVQKVRGESYSAEEFCSDVAVIQKMESAFQKFLQQSLGLNSTEYTISARSAYKSEAIAQKRLDNELKDFAAKGMEVKAVNGFRFND